MRILKEGYPFIFPSLAAGALLLIVSRTAPFLPLAIACAVSGAALIIFALFCSYFFRDPKIEITQGEDLILSPCNGTVIEIAEEGNDKIIRVFLSIFSVHLQRSPISGTVTSVTHKDGTFFAAWNPRAQAENEQNVITIQNNNQDDSETTVYVVRQIAGFLARRCVSWVQSGDILKAGDKIGMIKFSSQVDLHLPKSAALSVKPGDKTRAGITVMGIK
ncbi:MAG: phosphatidylserine decarboxylase [Treponema sp.]|jgi:phosphatidylserine decarboxylase|nr:phosphatidylserine decarboxylase [Treponema sp.]